MSRSGQQELISAEALLSLANYLRANPTGIRETANELATKFGLPEMIVRESLAVVTANRPKPIRIQSKGFWRTTALFIVTFANFLSKHAILVGLIIPCLGISIGIAVSPKLSSTVHVPLAVVGITIGFLLLIALAFSRGKTRIALLLSLAVAVSSVATETVYSIATNNERNIWNVLVGLVISILLITIINALILTPAAIAGAAFHLRKEQADEERQDRLQLLQRIFDLQSRIVSSEQPVRARTKFQRWQGTWRSRWLVVAISSGVLIGLVTLLGAYIVSDKVDGLPTIGQIVFALASLLLSVMLYPLVGFVAGSWWRGVFAGSIVYLFSLLISFIHPTQRELFQGVGDVMILVVALLISGLAGIGAHVEQRSEHKYRVAADDQTAMLLEIVRLQQLLQNESTEATVVVVDCVQSTRMKDSADPLAIEVSFGEFHKFVSDLVKSHGGTVYSVAGDGVISEFSDCRNAIAASKAILTRIGEFNSKQNRLASPFRCRIGVHTGQVHADLEQVKYSSVIDIAAHIEKRAPAGGIVVTDAVRSQLAEEDFAQLAEPVDGQTIHILLNPCD